MGSSPTGTEMSLGSTDSRAPSEGHTARATDRQRPEDPKLSGPRGGAAAPLIEMRGVSKAHLTKDRFVPVFEDFDLQVYPSEFLSIVGPSGCGKSTLLNLMSGLISPDAGSIAFRGEPVKSVNTRLGYVTQADTVLPWRTVRANIALGLEIKGMRRSERAAAVDAAIKAVGLEGFENMHPAQLSGGMRKRVQLARTLVCEPDTILCDEPFAALDAQTRMVMQQDLLRLRDERVGDLTTVFITHDMVEAILLGDRVLVLSARPTRPVAVEIINDLGDRSDLMALQETSQFRAHLENVWKVLSSQLDLIESRRGAKTA